MDLEQLRNNRADILTCPTKDETGLNDFQKKPDEEAIAIQRVGIEAFRIPLKFNHKDLGTITHDAEVSMYAYLQAGKTGINMSRFCQILQREAENTTVSNAFLEKILTCFRDELRDFKTETLIPEVEFQLKLSYPVKQKSLKSDNWGWQYYDCEIKAVMGEGFDPYTELTLGYKYSSTCPCSLSMAKQYEEDFRDAKTTEGTGIAVAHSQRSLATVSVKTLIGTEFSIEKLIALLRQGIPTETQSLVKRVDEQAFAILNGENPIFVEHATRRIAHLLEQEEDLLDWQAKVEHFESLHSHNAVAIIRKQKM